MSGTTKKLTTQEQQILVEQFETWAGLPDEMTRLTEQHCIAAAAEMARLRGEITRLNNEAIENIHHALELAVEAGDDLTPAERHAIEHGMEAACGFGAPTREMVRAMYKLICRQRGQLAAVGKRI
jgi:hypothetical protein